MPTLASLQLAAEPSWVGPTMAISLAVIAVSILGLAIALAVAALRLAAEARRLSGAAAGLQDDARRTLGSVRRLATQGEDLVVVLRHEAGAFAQTGRRVRRKMVRGIDRLESKLTDLETLYDVLHEEVEDTALDMAAVLRSARTGNGMLGRVRRLLAPGR